MKSSELRGGGEQMKDILSVASVPKELVSQNFHGDSLHANVIEDALLESMRIFIGAGITERAWLAILCKPGGTVFRRSPWKDLQYFMDF